MPTIAELSVLIHAKDEATSVLKGLSKTLDESHKAMAIVGGAMTALGSAGVAGFIAAGNAAADFQKTMSGVQAVMSAPEWSQFGSQLDSLAMKLGKDTAFSAKEAAQGLEELIKAGVTAQDVVGGLGTAVTNLAAATGTKIPQAAEIMANMKNAFSVPVEDSARQVDRLAGVVNATAVDMNQFKFALEAGGAAAKLAGVNIDEFTVAVGLMADHGIKGSDAGTSLKTMFNNLVPSSKTQIRAFEELGIITEQLGNRFFDAAGNAKPLQERMAILHEAITRLTAMDRTRLVHDAFGTDAMRAAAILAEEGATGFARVNAEIAKTTAAEAARIRLDNLAGSVEQLKGSLETLGITIGKQIEPIMRRIVDTATAVVNGFMELPSSVQMTVVAVLGAATAFAAIGGPLLLLAGALPSIAAGFSLMAGPLAAVAAPVALIGAAVAGLTVAWVTNWGRLRTETLRVWQAIQPVITGIGQTLLTMGGTVAKVLGSWKDFWIAAASSALGGAGAITQVANGIITWFRTSLWPTVVAFRDGWQAAWAEIGRVGVNIFPVLITIGQVVRDLGAAVLNVVGPWKDFWLDALGAAIGGAAGITNAANEIIKWFHDTLAPVLTAFRDRWQAVWSEIGRLAENIFPVLVNIGGAFRDMGASVLAVAGLWMDFWRGALSAAAENAPSIEEVVNHIIQWFHDDLAPTIAAFSEVWQTVWSEIGRVSENIFPVILHIGELFSGLGDGLIKTWEQWSAFWTDSTSAATTASVDITEIANGIIKWFHDDLSPMLDWAVGAWSYTWQSFLIETTKAWNLIQIPLQDLRDWLGMHLPPLLTAIKEQWGNFWGTVGPTLKLAWEIASPILASIKDWLGVQIPKVLGGAGEALDAFLQGWVNVLKTIAPVIGALASTAGGQFVNLNEQIQVALAKMRKPADDGGEGVGEAIGTGIANGIGGELDTVDAAAREAAQRALTAAKAELGISSPSRVMADEVGVPIMEGIGQGIQQESAAVGNQMMATVTGFVNMGRQAVQGFASGGYRGAGPTEGTERTGLVFNPAGDVIGNRPNAPGAGQMWTPIYTQGPGGQINSPFGGGPDPRARDWYAPTNPFDGTSAFPSQPYRGYQYDPRTGERMQNPIMPVWPGYQEGTNGSGFGATDNPEGNVPWRSSQWAGYQSPDPDAVQAGIRAIWQGIEDAGGSGRGMVEGMATPGWTSGSGSGMPGFMSPIGLGNPSATPFQQAGATVRFEGPNGVSYGTPDEAAAFLKEQEKAKTSTKALSRETGLMSREADRAAPPVREVSDVLADLSSSARSAVANTTLFTGGIANIGQQLAQSANVYSAYQASGVMANAAYFSGTSAGSAYGDHHQGGSNGAPSIGPVDTAGYYGAAYAGPVVTLTPDQMAQVTAGAIAAGLLPDELPHFGDGGIVTRPTLAIVGEKGAERISPLGGGGGGGTTIIVNYSPVMGADTEVERDRVARDMARRIERERRRLGL